MSYFNISPQKPLLSNEDEKVLKVSHFGGVDYTTSTLKMANNRAIDSLNYIRKSYVLEKRNGLNDELQIDGVIYDLWHFLDYLVIHWNGNISVYNYSNLSFIKTFSDVVRSDTKIMAFESGEKLYILGGIKYLVLYRKKYKFGIDDIDLIDASQLAYIPTTTIGINQENYEGKTSRSTLDDQNLLVDRVINELIGGSSIKTYYQSSDGEIFDTPQDNSTSFENPNAINKYILDRAIHLEENTNIIKHLPQINIRYNWEDIIKIILRETDNVESLYEYEVSNIDNSLTAEQTTFTFSYKAIFAYAYNNYDLSKIEWYFNSQKLTDEKKMFLEQTKVFQIPSDSNFIEEIVSATVLYPTGNGDETTSASVSKKVKVRKYQQRVYLYWFSCRKRWEADYNDIEAHRDIFKLAIANSKQKDEVSYKVEFVLNNKKIPLGITTQTEIINYVIGITKRSVNNQVKNDVSKFNYGKIKEVYSADLYTLYPWEDGVISVYDSYINNPNTYFLINGKEVKPSISVLYYGGSGNTDTFYKDFNRRLEGIGVKYDA